jgi:hypothetical protein
MTQKNFLLGISNFNYADLYNTARLNDLLAVFDESVKYHDTDLYTQFIAYRNTQGADLSPEQQSAIMVKVSQNFGQFVAKLLKKIPSQEVVILILIHFATASCFPFMIIVEMWWALALEALIKTT